VNTKKDLGISETIGLERMSKSRRETVFTGEKDFQNVKQKRATDIALLSASVWSRRQPHLDIFYPLCEFDGNTMTALQYQEMAFMVHDAHDDFRVEVSNATILEGDLENGRISHNWKATGVWVNPVGNADPTNKPNVMTGYMQTWLRNGKIYKQLNTFPKVEPPDVLRLREGMYEAIQQKQVNNK